MSKSCKKSGILSLRRATLHVTCAALVLVAGAAADTIVVLEPGETYSHGAACGAQELTLQNNSRPSVGNSNFALLVDGAVERGVVGLVFGTSIESSNAGPLPLDLGALGFTGCTLHVSLEALVLRGVTGATAVFAAPIPDDASLIGLAIHTQAFALSAEDQTLSMSSALSIVIGA